MINDPILSLSNDPLSSSICRIYRYCSFLLATKKKIANRISRKELFSIICKLYFLNEIFAKETMIREVQNFQNSRRGVHIGDLFNEIIESIYLSFRSLGNSLFASLTWIGNTLSRIIQTYFHLQIIKRRWKRSCDWV